MYIIIVLLTIDAGFVVNLESDAIPETRVLDEMPLIIIQVRACAENLLPPIHIHHHLQPSKVKAH